jgi:hypothetical protein
MTETEKAAQEAMGLLTALIKVTRGLGLTPEQTAAAVLDALTLCPRAPKWWAALARLHADGIRMLPGKADAPPRFHS